MQTDSSGDVSLGNSFCRLLVLASVRVRHDVDSCMGQYVALRKHPEQPIRGALSSKALASTDLHCTLPCKQYGQDIRPCTLPVKHDCVAVLSCA